MTYYPQIHILLYTTFAIVFYNITHFEKIHLQYHALFCPLLLYHAFVACHARPPHTAWYTVSYHSSKMVDTHRSTMSYIRNEHHHHSLHMSRSFINHHTLSAVIILLVALLFQEWNSIFIYMVDNTPPNLSSTVLPYTICVTVQYHKQTNTTTKGTEVAKSMKGNMPSCQCLKSASTTFPFYSHCYRYT
jgi:hypothetical protein